MKKSVLYVVLFFLLVLVAACSNSTSEYTDVEVSSDSSSSEASENIPEIEGMIVVRGGTVTLGSDDTKYRPSERLRLSLQCSYISI